MIPFENNGHLNDNQRNFNRRLSQCRVRVENAFGRSKGKWRRMKFLHARNQANVVDHITVSFVLHNFILRHGERMLEVSDIEICFTAAFMYTLNVYLELCDQLYTILSIP